jgi:hypothetical protein
VGGDITPRLYHSIVLAPVVFDMRYIHPNLVCALVALVLLYLHFVDVRYILLGQLHDSIDAMLSSNA